MKRIQRERTKGFKLQEATRSGLPVKYVGRPTKWGNPFKLTIDGEILYYKENKIFGSPWCYYDETMNHTIQDIVNLYKIWITGNLPDKNIEKALPKIPDITELKGYDLACFCPIGSPCHADILIELLNEK